MPPQTGLQANQDDKNNQDPSQTNPPSSSWLSEMCVVIFPNSFIIMKRQGQLRYKDASLHLELVNCVSSPFLKWLIAIIDESNFDVALYSFQTRDPESVTPSPTWGFKDKPRLHF